MNISNDNAVDRSMEDNDEWEDCENKDPNQREKDEDLKNWGLKDVEMTINDDP